MDTPSLDRESAARTSSGETRSRDNQVRLAVAGSLARFGAHRWGRDFLSANGHGNLEFREPDREAIDLHELANALESKGIRTPFVLRFPRMIRAQMDRFHAAFAHAAEVNEYVGGHVGVYPLKVNQRRSVVDTVVQAREAARFGLEAGSKPELLLAMSQPVAEGLPLLCNGFKDREFMRMAFHAAELGHEVIVVLESVREVRRYLHVAGEHDWKAHPKLGVRAKLYTKGSGRWQASGGEQAKFGLTTNEMLSVIESLEDAGRIADLVLLHFHVGSQITQIKRIKLAAREGARLYVELRQRCPGMRYLDLGGGIGVDYDGSRTSYPSSVNYTLDEYASQVTYEVKQVCEDPEHSDTQHPHPTLITESGRVLVASHAVLVADMREVQGEAFPPMPPREDEHPLIGEMRYTAEHINAKNVEEYFHDAVDFRDECLQLFSRGYLNLDDRATAEALLQQVRIKCAAIVGQMKHPPEEIVDYLKGAFTKYLVNFSVFQSLPDTWSIGQVFPVAPLSRHLERSNVNARLVDITCDSDGCVSEFAHPDENLRFLPLLRRNDGDRYYLGFFLVGAYQDSLANEHNLFGRCAEVVVRSPEDDTVLPGSEMVEFGPLQLEVKGGMTNEDVLSLMDWDVEGLNHMLRDRHLQQETTLGIRWAAGLLQGSPYLNNV